MAKDHKKLKLNITPSKMNIYKRYNENISYNNFKIEFVGARKESYSKDSRNPNTKPGNFMDDMLRRDFTINTLAIRLNKENFGELVDTLEVTRTYQKNIVHPMNQIKPFQMIH